MGITIWPSANDVSVTPGHGNVAREQAVAALLDAVVARNFVLSGLTVPSSHPNLVLPVNPGVAFLDGRWVESDAVINVICTVNQLNYVYFKILKDVGGNVASAQIETNITGIGPSDSVLLALADAGNGDIPTVTDVRLTNPTFPHNHGSTQNGGTLGSEVVGLSQFKTKIVQFQETFMTFNFVGLFRVQGIRYGHFRTTLPGATIVDPIIINLVNAHDSFFPGELYQVALPAIQGAEGPYTLTVEWDEYDTVQSF